MNETIICALIAGISAVAGQWLVTRKKNRDSEIKDAMRNQKIDDRLNSIERKLDIHNGYAEKLGGIDKSIAEIQKDIEYLKNKS